MHAASVYPEPGSNSLKNYFTVLGTAIYFLELCLLLFYFFPWVFIDLIVNVYSLLGIVRVNSLYYVF